MMVNCPRCGFSQPEDQYCARCGVDMLNYQPARKPLLRRLAANTIFQLFALAVVVTIVFSYAREQRQRELAERIAEIESAHSTQTITRRSTEDSSASVQKREIASSTPEEQTESQSSSLIEDEPEDTATTNSASANTTALQASTPPTPTAENRDADEATANAASDMNATATTSGGATPPQNVRVTFAAVSRRVISELVAGADPNSTTTMGPFTLGVVPQAANRFRALQGTEYWELLDSSSRTVQVGQPVEFYGGQRDSTTGHFFGFIVEVTPSDYDEASTHMHLRILRYLREGSEIDVFSVPVPETVSIPRAGGAFVTGALFSKQATTLEERRFYEPIKVLRILTTEPYRNNLTDLVILIEPK